VRIAHVHADLPGETNGGVAHQVHLLANTLVRRGHDVTVVTYSPRPAGALYAVQTVALAPVLRHSKLFRLLGTGLVFSRQDYSGFDIVHFHGDNYMSCVPHLRTYYGSALDEMLHARSWRWRMAQLVTYPQELLGTLAATRSVGISQATTRALPGVRKVIPCGVDLTQFAAGSERSGAPSILFVGTLAGRKRGLALVEAFRRVIAPAHPSAELWLVTDETVPGERIRCLGRVDSLQLAELYRKAWIFCLPSSYEGFGVPYVEALASGTPVVATPNAGAREVLEEGRYGVLVEEDRLGPVLAEVLADAGWRARLTAAGLVRARAFSFDRVAAAYEAIYWDLCAKRHR
jgi:phosphatidylinositol alpha-mannosyltransferase